MWIKNIHPLSSTYPGWGGSEGFPEVPLPSLSFLTRLSHSHFCPPGELHDYWLNGDQSETEGDRLIRRSGVQRPGSGFRRSGHRSHKSWAPRGHQHHYRVHQLLIGNGTTISLMVSIVTSKISAVSLVSCNFSRWPSCKQPGTQARPTTSSSGSMGP